MADNRDELDVMLYDKSEAEMYAARKPFGNDGFVLQQNYSTIADRVENFPVRDDDVFVTGFQKTGTTWAQEIVWCIVNDLNLPNSTTPIMDLKFPLLEMCLYTMPKTAGEARWDSLNYLTQLPGKRFIKTHLPWQLLPQKIRSGENKPKILYVYRDPKDTCISLYFHLWKLGMFKGSIEEICEEMLNDAELYCPFWKHVEGYLQQESLPNLCITTYEEMKRDLPGVIRRVAEFLGKPLTEEQVDLLHNHLTYSSMVKNK